MSISTPSRAMLNFHTSAYLTSELKIWRAKLAALGSFSADAPAINVYLNALQAEIDQRKANGSRAYNILSAPLDFFGLNFTTSASGATSAPSAVADTVGNAVASVGSGIKNVTMIGAGAVFVLGFAYIYFNKRS